GRLPGVRHRGDVAVHGVAPDVQQRDVRVEPLRQCTGPLHHARCERRVGDRYEDALRRVLWWRGDDENRHRRRSGDAVRRRTEELRWAEAIAVRTDRDQGRAHLGGDGGDLLVRLADTYLD